MKGGDKMSLNVAIFLYGKGICVTFDADKHIPIFYKEN